jgi:hypothetical protein
MVPAWPESGFRKRAARLGVGWDVSGPDGRGRQLPRDGTSTVGSRGWGRRREGYAGRWEVELDNIAALAAEREQLARTPEGGSRGGGFGVAPG